MDVLQHPLLDSLFPSNGVGCAMTLIMLTSGVAFSLLENARLSSDPKMCAVAPSMSSRRFLATYGSRVSPWKYAATWSLMNDRLFSGATRDE